MCLLIDIVGLISFILTNKTAQIEFIIGLKQLSKFLRWSLQDPIY